MWATWRNHNIPPLMHLNISAASSRCALSNGKTLHTVTTLILIPQMTRIADSTEMTNVSWRNVRGWPRQFDVRTPKSRQDRASLNHWMIRPFNSTVASNNSLKLCPLDPTVGSGSPVGSPKLQKCLPQWEKKTGCRIIRPVTRLGCTTTISDSDRTTCIHTSLNNVENLYPTDLQYEHLWGYSIWWSVTPTCHAWLAVWVLGRPEWADRAWLLAEL